MISEKEDVAETLYEYFWSLQGSNAIAFLQMDEEESYLHLINKKKTRGLVVWENSKGEVIFCSRKSPVLEEFGEIVAKGKSKEKGEKIYHEDVGLVLSFPLISR